MLAEPHSGAWRATIDGHRLPSATAYGWAQAWRLPAAGGRLTVQRSDAGRTAADLSGPVPQRVMQVIEEQINPAIAAHGGSAELVAVEDDTAYVRLGGGCVGCGMASVTLGQGIEVAILQAVPEVQRVVDVTDHASGTNPYYEAAKK